MKLVASLVGLTLALVCSSPLSAQEPPPPIGPFVVDLHGTATMFPSNDVQLAQSRSLDVSQLPGLGIIGADLGAHFYLFKWRAITFGVGGQATFARSHSSPAPVQGTQALQPVNERFVSAAPQLSFNFGTGHGWSYLSGGIGRSQWSIYPKSADPGKPDTEKLFTINYGGGARWFAKKHLAFSLDVRFYAIDPGTPVSPNPGAPRTTLMIIGAGVSLR